MAQTPALTPWRDLHGDAFDGTRVCVTGGAGFIGSHLGEALAGLGAHLTVLDDLSGGDETNLAPFRDADGFRFVEGSIIDPAALRDAIGDAQLVFHLAAMGSVPRSVREPGRYQLVNTTGTSLLLEVAREAGVKRVMFAASSSVYGDTPTLPKHEQMPSRPQSPYAATKVAGESLMRAYARCYDLDAVSLRYFNIFGPRQNANSAYAAVIAAFAKALHAGERPVIFGDGEQSRDFTFVDNAVHANLLAARHDGRLNGEAFNVACGQRVTVNELAAEMAAAWGKPELTPEHRDERAGDVKHSLAALDATEQGLGYEPIVPMDQGLAATVAWYRRALAATPVG